jgi:hypothetical protein
VMGLAHLSRRLDIYPLRRKCLVSPSLFTARHYLHFPPSIENVISLPLLLQHIDTTSNT